MAIGAARAPKGRYAARPPLALDRLKQRKDDWGDLNRGEPALHGRFRGACGDIDEDTWARGRGWGVFFGVVLLDAGRGGAGAAFARIGRQTLRHALAASGAR